MAESLVVSGSENIYMETMARGEARCPLPWESGAAGRLAAGLAPAGGGLSPSHLTWRWRASLQANLRGAARACLKCSTAEQPQGPWAERVSVPQGTALGRQRVLGKSMAYQVPGRAWVGDLVRGHSVQLLCPLPPLWIWGWLPGADHRWGSSPRLLCGSTQGASCSAWPGSQAPEEPRRSHLPPTDPEASAPRLCRQELGPSLLAPKVTQGWSSDGWQVPQPPGSASFHHPPPSCLRICLAPRGAPHGAGVPHRPLAPSATSIWAGERVARAT